MNQRRIDWLAAGIVFVVTLALYMYVVSPTLAFWDVGEFLSCCYNLGVPHPPGTPLYVLIGRLFSLIPWTPEIALRLNFISVLSGAMVAALVVLLVSRVVRSFKKSSIVERAPWLPTVAGVVGAVFTLVAFSVWDNSLEAEVYAPSSLIGLGVVYLALLWRERTEKREQPVGVETGAVDVPQGIRGMPKIANRYMLLALYIIFLAAGIHLTPVMMLFALIPFIALVDHKVLPTFFLGILALSFILFAPGWPQIAVISLFVIYFFTQVKGSGAGYIPATLFTGAWLILIVLAVAKVPVVGILIGAALVVAAFIYAGIRYKLDMKFFALGALLIAIALSVQFYLMIRAQQHPSINMVNPSNWKSFLSVLRREQYGIPTVENQLWPRKTVVDPDTGRATGIGPIAGIFWQYALYFKYFFWQWGYQVVGQIKLGLREIVVTVISTLAAVFSVAGAYVIITKRGARVLWSILTVAALACVGLLSFFYVYVRHFLLMAVPISLGLVGLYSLARRDRKLFWLLLTTFLVSSFGLVIYLNMRFGHTGPLPLNFSGLPQEVRERDYFFTFSYVFYALFTGFGFFELVSAFGKKIKANLGARVLGFSSGGIMLALAVVIAMINMPMLTRRYDWVPVEYGYNLLASCDEPGVFITNGDNDTFPLWFVQEVPSQHYQDPSRPYKPGVINANLSLLNTSWYVEHLKRKGAPISFVYESKNERVRLADGQGYVAHPPIKKGTFVLYIGGRTVKDDRRGRLIDAKKKVIGEVSYDIGRLRLTVPPEQSDANGDFVLVSYGSHEIDRLPPYTISADSTRAIPLAEIIIRDMLATNSGITYSSSEKDPPVLFDSRRGGLYVDDTLTSIPHDYRVSQDSFLLRVMENYKEGVMPIYFSTTVSPGRVRQFAPYLIQEALAYRFRKPRDSSDYKRVYPDMNFEKTYRIFTQEFIMSSIRDPRVRHDEQTEMLFAQYGVLMQEIAMRMSMRGDLLRAYELYKPVATFDVDDEVRKMFLMNLYAFAGQAGQFQDAQAYRKELEERKWLGADFYLRQGYGLLDAGDTSNAVASFEQAFEAVETGDRQMALQIFGTYLELMRDTQRARSVADRWDKLSPGDDVSIQMYLAMNDIGEALRVLDQTIVLKPGQTWRVALRDSLRNVYNTQRGITR